MGSEPILEARAVTKIYPPRNGLLRRSGGAVTAVHAVSCSLATGESLGLVGESGCGKTTMAKLLVGLVPPSSGDILVRGKPLADLRRETLREARRAVQLIFQNPLNSLNPRMTVEEILSEPLLIHRLARGAARHRRVVELLDAVQLPAAYGSRLPRQLSGGECQRGGIARALATEPEVLICDEPIASLDVSVGAQILTLLRTLRRQRGMALLFISHDLGAVASLCERVAVMQGGRLLELTPTEELLRQARHPYTQLLIRAAQLDLDAAAA